ncbi:gigaxonin-like isoform X2 [Oratosquilla oratoria]
MVHLEQISKATFQSVLDFIYTGRAKLHHENIQDLLQAADLLLMKDLKDLCINYLLRQIEPGNCLGILQFARRYTCPRLEFCAKKFIFGHFREMTMSEEFQFLTEDQVVSLLEEDGLQIHSEREVLFALVQWIKHNQDKNPNIRGIMEKCLRFGLEYSDLKEACHDGVTELFRDGWDSLFGEHKEKQLSHRPRGMMQAMVFTDGGLNKVSRRMWAVDLWQHKRDYRLIKSFHIARRNHRIVAEGGYLFVIGGCDAEGRVLSSGEKFDLKQEVWMPIAPMTTPRCHFGLVSHAGKLYAIGGENNNRLLKCVEEYDIYANKWRPLPELSLARKYAAYAVSGNKIFVIGGQHISESEGHKSVRLLESMEVFNIKDELWVSGPPPQEERFGAVAVGHADCVYLFGGVRPLQCPTSQGLLKTCGMEFLSPRDGLGWLHHGDPDLSFRGNTFLKAVVCGGEIVVISRKNNTDDGSLICHMMKGWGYWNFLPRLEVVEEPADCTVYDLPLSTFSKLPTIELNITGTGTTEAL